jgi:hypothetical protein
MVPAATLALLLASTVLAQQPGRLLVVDVYGKYGFGKDRCNPKILGRRKTDPFRGPWKRPALKARRDIEVAGTRVYIAGRAKTENGNSGPDETGRPGVGAQRGSDTEARML